MSKKIIVTEKFNEAGILIERITETTEDLLSDYPWTYPSIPIPAPIYPAYPSYPTTSPKIDWAPYVTTTGIKTASASVKESEKNNAV